MSFLQLERHIPPVEPEIIFRIGDFPIASSTILAVLISIGLISFGLYVTKKSTLVPGAIQNILEYFYELIEGLIGQMTGSREAVETIFPLVATLMAFIFISNMIGMVPGISSITYEHVPILRAPTSDFNTTIGLSFAVIIVFHSLAIYKLGFFKHIGKFVKFSDLVKGFKKGFGAGFLAIIDFVVGLLEVISEVAKVFSLSLRLFGNIYAGEVLTFILLGLFAYAVPSAWFMLATLGAAVQTMVFASLASTYYALATADHSEDHGNGH